MARSKKNKPGKAAGKAQASSPSNDNSTGSFPSRPHGRRPLAMVAGMGLLLMMAAAIWYGLGYFGGARTANDTPNTDALSLPRLDAESWQTIDNAAEDGWQTEAFSDKANAQLKTLGKLMTSGKLDQTKLQSLLRDDFRCGGLYPSKLATVFSDSVLTVQRSEGFGNQAYQGAQGFAEAIAHLTKVFQDAEDLRFKFKLFRVSPESDSIVTRQYLALSGRTEQGMVEQNATWVATWDSSTSTKPPRLIAVEVISFEEVKTLAKGRTLYSDVTQSALANNDSYQRQLLRGYNHWLDRTESRPYWERLGTPGLAIGDVNGDGLDDLYLCQERGLPNLLFLQNADGTVRDISRQAQVDWIEDSRSALIVDLDNDGDQDLVVGVSGGVVVAENDGQATFRLRTVLPADDDVKSLSAVDYDRDGKLDIYAAVYYPNVFRNEADSAGIAISNLDQVIYDSNRGGANGLFRNQVDGDNWTFSDVTDAVGLNVKNARFSLAATWEDYDNDGDQDLYVANDYGRNNFYRNDDGQFTEVAGEAGIEDFNLAMSAAWGDFDRDGLMDLYIGNMFSAAGNRVTFQEHFREGASEQEIKRFQHLARGNTLFRNTDEQKFEDVSDAAGVTMGRWAWSTDFVDLNNDGWQDLVVANGMITTEDTGDC